MEITFGDGDRVDARYKGLIISTSQDRSQPAPFDLFLASIGTCAGYYVHQFCQKRGLPTEGIRIEQRKVVNRKSKMIERIEIDIKLPDEFPERYREAVIRSAQLCSVKKHLEHPPAIEVRTSTPEPV
jgi:ribosomal protein S12 methylthiotransferase accessory factor